MELLMENVLVLFQSIFEEGILILLCCYVLGELVKRIDKINNEDIPIVVSIAGVILAIISKSFIFPEDPYIIVGFKGLILGWASTGGYELIRSKRSHTSE